MKRLSPGARAPAKAGRAAQAAPSRKAVGPLLLCTWLLGTLTAPLGAQFLGQEAPVWLETEVWTRLEPIPPGGLERPPVREGFERPLLEEARRQFSAQIYGLGVLYRPLDLRSAAQELLEVRPLGEIPWGDPDLQFIDHRVELREDRVYARFQYRLKPHERSRWLAWRREALPEAAGWGEIHDEQVQASRWRAWDQAVKEALRNHLRPREHAKPREIRAEVLALEPVRFMEGGGRLRARTRVLVRILESRGFIP